MTDNLPAIQKDRSLVEVNGENEVSTSSRDLTISIILGAMVGVFIALFFLTKKNQEDKTLPEPPLRLAESTIDTPDAVQTDVDIDTPVKVATETKEEALTTEDENIEDEEVETNQSEQVLPDVSTRNNRVVDVSKHN
ncbi:hypothetical protein [Aliicoccus persicus]|uniref:Uncharacterized protein n=1 Tax=Aliicoccus persicus TaxID=930138 RepID=A0A662Z1Q8_9STAP|nr:hypothetical protein [Aliicoccus persicus]SEV87640.1 hypothetical protein SAMN05192557_0665 [Aliicoccus persicus]